MHFLTENERWRAILPGGSHQGGQHLGAAGAQALPVHRGQYLPAPLALVPGGVFHGGLDRLAHRHLHLGDDEQVGQVRLVHLRQEGVLGRDGEDNLGLQALADLLLRPG